MRRLCWPLLAVVVARFALNPEILDYPLSATPLINWILWSYGISIAALAIGRRYLRVRQDQLRRQRDHGRFDGHREHHPEVADRSV